MVKLIKKVVTYKDKITNEEKTFTKVIIRHVCPDTGNVTDINIPGREESLYITHDEFDDTVINIKAYSFENGFDIGPVYAWLRTAKTLRFNNSNRYYKVKKLNAITPNYSGHGRNLYTISFVVSPFRYFVSDDALRFTTKTFTVTNGGNTYSRPVYTIYGSGNIEIATIDGSGNEIEKIKVNGITSSVVIDSDRLIIHEDGVLRISEGVIPLLQSGTNRFKVTGNVESVTIRRNQRDV